MREAFPFDKLDILIPAKSVSGLTVESLGRVFADDPFKRVSAKILLDGNEQDWGASACEDLFPNRVRILRNPGKSRGAAWARNTLAAQTEADYLVFVDSDVLLPTQFVSRLASAVKRQRKPSVLAPHIVSFRPKFLASRFFSQVILGPSLRNGHLVVPSTVLGMPRSLWETTGGFSEKFINAGGEDTEWVLRNSNQNPEFRIHFTSTLTVRHQDPRRVHHIIQRAWRYGNQASLLSSLLLDIQNESSDASERNLFELGSETDLLPNLNANGNLFFSVRESVNTLMWRDKILINVKPQDAVPFVFLRLAFRITYLLSMKGNQLLRKILRGDPQG